MTAKKIKEIEGYLKTQNEWYNKFVLEMITEAIENELFKDIEVPAKVFDECVEAFMEQWEQPIKTINSIKGIINKAKLDQEQELFCFKQVKRYIDNSSFGESEKLEPIDKGQTVVVKLLKAEIKRLENKFENDNLPVSTIENLRTDLKAIMENELEKIPEYLNELEPKDKLNFIHKMIPFILPKVNSISPFLGEKDD